ncbi:hypothetical protein M378DRAFT_8329 [Amanita muscaria Koide BX008]|uniref:Cyclin-domain-containing protein n=1 Tax=Amanita muscaria (strain Koide BX008) TaxID=946122 RepID=A0A0C2TNY3_AMAMK|nr:hypothetical protein M378DRAFT_8329 [Amanita muscaria Koide BX008]
MDSSSSDRVELPAAFEDVDIDHLVQLIADMLERVMALNDRIALSPESLTRFHSRSAPSIDILDYLRRIVRYTNVEKSCLLVTLCYIDRICARVPLFILSSLTCHRFVIASITASSKGLSDIFCTNSLYAKVGGISVTELNVLEREFLSAIDWQLMCTREILQNYYVNLVRTHSTDRYTRVGADTSSDSDVEMEGGQTRPSSPDAASRSQQRYAINEASAILMEPGSVSFEQPRPTVEQNMAFAELQQSRDTERRES